MKHMQDTVNEICESLEKEPSRWEVTTFLLKDSKTGIKYWLDSNSIQKIWNESTTVNVFSYEQGVNICECLKKFNERNATLEQQEIINAMHKAKVVKVVEQKPTSFFEMVKGWFK